jgi:site-specific recombinase XerD
MPRKPLTPKFIPSDEPIVDNVKSLFIAHISANRSPSTATTYRHGVESFERWMTESNPDVPIVNATEDMVNRYLAAMGTVAKASTVVTYWSGLRAFFTFTTERGLSAINPTAMIKKPRMEKVVIPNIPTDAVKALMNTCDPNGFTGVRDRAIMAVLFSTGIRRAELIGMKVDSYSPKHQTILVFGKGSKERLVHVDDPTRTLLNRYLTARAMHGLRDSTNAMWLGKRGAFNGTAVGQMLTRRAVAAGLPADVKINPHAWRHTYAHNYLDQGGSPIALLSNGGWENLNMVDRYSKADRERRALRESERLSLGSLVC